MSANYLENLYLLALIYMLFYLEIKNNDAIPVLLFTIDSKESIQFSAEFS